MEKQQLASGEHGGIGEEEIICLAPLPACTPQALPSCSAGETDFHPDLTQPKSPQPRRSPTHRPRCGQVHPPGQQSRRKQLQR